VTEIGMVLTALISWAIGLLILVFVIAAGVRIGMRWSRSDARKEQAARDNPASVRPPRREFKPYRTGRNFK
jgi:hypothetical protein